MSASDDLREAARRGDLDAIRAALADGADIDSRDEKGWTALMWAASEARGDAVDLLLESGADPGVRDRLVQDAAGIALYSQYYRGGGVGLSTRISRHPAYVRRIAALGEAGARK